MKQVGAHEAETHLSRLLDEVARGESVAITKHGRAVALLMPVTSDANRVTAAQAVTGLRRSRRGRRLDGVGLRELIDGGGR